MTYKIKKAYTRTRVSTKTPIERKTKCVQSEKHSSDVNNIVARAFQTGQLPTLMNREPIEQLPDVQSYQDALNKVVFANQQFEQLPSAIRAKFENDPRRLLASLDDPSMRSELQNLGIINQDIPEPTPAPSKRSNEDENPTEKPSADA